MTTQRQIPTPAIIAVAAALALLAFLAGFAVDGVSLDGAKGAARLTARVSFYWFAAAWGASALARLWPGGWRGVLLRRRRAVGLGFATAHFIHLGAILTAALVFGLTFPVVTIVGGGTAFVLLAAMAVTSNDAAVHRMGTRNWKLLHATGGYYLAAIFGSGYLAGIPTKPVSAIPASLVFVAIVVMRIVVWARARTRRRAIA